MDKFRDGENARLQKCITSGKVVDAKLLTSEENNKLKAKIEVMQSQGDGTKVRSSTLYCSLAGVYVKLVSFGLMLCLFMSGTSKRPIRSAFEPNHPRHP